MAYIPDNATTGNQTLLAINTGTSSTPVWTNVYGITEFTSSQTVKTTDITTLSSVATETLATLIDNGKLQITANRASLDPGQAAVLASFNSKLKAQYKITLPENPGETANGDVITFSAICDEFSGISSVSSTKQIVTKIGLMITGGITLVVGS